MTHPAMDAAAYDQMKSMMGDAFRDVIDLCLEAFPQQMELIKSSVEQQDADAVFAAAHRLKSSCGSIGAYGLADKAQEIELIARSGSSEIPQPSIDDLEQTISEVSDFLRQELS